MADTKSKFMTLLLFGAPKTGKSWTTATAPGRKLILDTEVGAYRYVEGKRIDWDPERQDMPAEGDWEICHVQVNNPRVIDLVLDLVRKGGHPFDSIILDSITFLQDQEANALAKNGAMRIQDWGTLKSKFEQLTLTLCELAQEQHLVLVLTAGLIERDGKQGTNLQGSFGRKLPYYLDLSGLLYTKRDANGNKRRGLRVEASETVDAGNRVGIEEEIIWDPNISDIVERYGK